MARNPDMHDRFQVARGFVPEEIRSQLDHEVRQLRERIARIEAQKAQLDPRPGDYSALDTGDYCDYWESKDGFYDGVDRMEDKVFDNLFDRLETPVADTSVLDLGCGSGRALQLMDGILQRRGASEEERRAFAANYHGLELDDTNIDLSRVNLGKLGMPAENIHKGNFRDKLPEALQGKFGVVTMMYGAFSYNQNETQASEALETINEALKPGGILLLDTIELTFLKSMPNEHEIGQFRDLTNFHTNMTRMYAAEHADSNFSTDQAMRFPVRGSTAVVGNPDNGATRHPDNSMIVGPNAYTREIVTLDYFQYLVEKCGADLELMNDGRQVHQLESLDEKAAAAIGRRWIDQNGMRPYLRAEVSHRLSQEGGPHMKALYEAPYRFVHPEQVRQSNLVRDLEEVDMIIDELIAPAMVNTYAKEFYYFRKRG